MADKQNRDGRDDEFPLDAYVALYTWIGNWAEEACDPEQRRIAQAAYESLTSVGILMRDVMRQMADEIEALPGPKTVH
jgi:hypothetical protein